MNVFREVSLSMDFTTLESADDWIDAMIEEYEDDYDSVYTNIRGEYGTYTAKVSFSLNTWDDPDGTSLVSESDREPDLFNAS